MVRCKVLNIVDQVVLRLDEKAPAVGAQWTRRHHDAYLVPVLFMYKDTISLHAGEAYVAMRALAVAHIAQLLIGILLGPF